jgi:hypothetical protein
MFRYCQFFQPVAQMLTCDTPGCRYRQIGNAVAVPVGRALGYSLAMAYLNKIENDPLMALPPKFAFSHNIEDTTYSRVDG